MKNKSRNKFKIRKHENNKKKLGKQNERKQKRNQGSVEEICHLACPEGHWV